jgi:hypothetical protein
MRTSMLKSSYNMDNGHKMIKMKMLQKLEDKNCGNYPAAKL